MKCNNCGFENAEGTQFCSACGNALNSAAPQGPAMGDAMPQPPVYGMNNAGEPEVLDEKSFYKKNVSGGVKICLWIAVIYAFLNTVVTVVEYGPYIASMDAVTLVGVVLGLVLTLIPALLMLIKKSGAAGIFLGCVFAFSGLIYIMSSFFVGILLLALAVCGFIAGAGLLKFKKRYKAQFLR